MSSLTKQQEAIADIMMVLHAQMSPAHLEQTIACEQAAWLAGAQLGTSAQAQAIRDRCENAKRVVGSLAQYQLDLIAEVIAARSEALKAAGV